MDSSNTIHKHNSNCDVIKNKLVHNEIKKLPTDPRENAFKNDVSCDDSDVSESCSSDSSECADQVDGDTR